MTIFLLYIEQEVTGVFGHRYRYKAVEFDGTTAWLTSDKFTNDKEILTNYQKTHKFNDLYNK